ncbi:DUF6174 domain-containing protein [Deinococcus sp.]|uniref:DUF6174 domain-containing protein n=1 Tax=Deinococcus sp. TaxID=47478 RepID=UPI003CC691F3
MRLPFLMPLVVAASLLSGCSYNQANGCRDSYQRPDFSALAQRLAAAQSRWQAASIQNYRYDLARSLEPVSLPTVRITVMGGQVTAVDVLTQTPPGNPTTAQGVTVGELLAELKAALARPLGPCTDLTMAFDPADGHPLRASFGNALDGLQDGGGGWTVSNFTRL